MKTWTNPELIVLVRSKPEEAVLHVCKTAGVHNTNWNSQVDDCKLGQGLPYCAGESAS